MSLASLSWTTSQSPSWHLSDSNFIPLLYSSAFQLPHVYESLGVGVDYVKMKVQKGLGELGAESLHF